MDLSIFGWVGGSGWGQYSDVGEALIDIEEEEEEKKCKRLSI